MTQDKIIKYSDDESATYRTDIKGWVSSKGHYYGKDEHLARYDGCTHKECECGESMEKKYTICENCRYLKYKENYSKYPIETWEDEKPITPLRGDEYFWDWEEVFEYLDERNAYNIEGDKNITLEDLMLCHTEEVPIPTIDISDVLYEYYSNADMDDIDIHPSVEKAVDELNTALLATVARTYAPVHIAVNIIGVSND